jgi:hypothetical protein
LFIHIHRNRNLPFAIVLIPSTSSALSSLLLSGNVLVSPPIGVDRTVRQRDFAAFASPHHALDGSEQKCSCLENLAKLPGAINVSQAIWKDRSMIQCCASLMRKKPDDTLLFPEGEFAPCCLTRQALRSR